MSYPRLGNSLEVSGDFSIEFDWERTYKNGVEWYSITPNKDSFEIENDYFLKLFNQGKIALYWSIFCSKTFYFSNHKNFDQINIPTLKIGGAFDINYYFIADKNFKFSPNDGDVNSFFMGEYKIEQGSILSIDTRKKVIKPNISDLGSSSSIVKFKLDSKLPKEFRVDFDKDKFIWVFVKNKQFTNKLRRLLIHKKTKGLIVNSFFGAILIDAIRKLSDQDIHTAWSEDLKEMIGFEEGKKDLYEDFDYALNEFNESFFNDKQTFFHAIIKQLEDLVL